MQLIDLGYGFTRLVAVRHVVSPVNISLDAVRTLGDYIGVILSSDSRYAVRFAGDTCKCEA